MPLDEHDQNLVVRSPLLRRLQLNAQSREAVGSEAVASRLLWISLAAQCLRPDAEVAHGNRHGTPPRHPRACNTITLVSWAYVV